MLPLKAPAPGSVKLFGDTLQPKSELKKLVN